MNDWLTFLQGASNAAASNVSGPIDLITWALRKAGVPIDTPVGGSDWMAQNGLTKPAGGAAGLLGEAAGMSAPIAAAAKAPQIAAGLLKMGENAAAPRTVLGPSAGQRGMIAWHGSPHEFDFFDKSRFGSGGFENLSSGAANFEPAVYLSTSEKHAQRYGPNLLKVDVNTRGAATDKVSKELNEWARQSGYKNAQAMIDRYYEGSPYLAADLDKRINSLLQRSPTGVAIVDFGNLLIDGKTPVGKVIATKDFNALKILAQNGMAP